MDVLWLPQGLQHHGHAPWCPCAQPPLSLGLVPPHGEGIRLVRPAQGLPYGCLALPGPDWRLWVQEPPKCQAEGGGCVEGTHSPLLSQFQAGPYGCILLTLSAILSRSLEL